MSYEEDLDAEKPDETSPRPPTKKPTAKSRRLFTSIKVLLLAVAVYWAWNLYTGVQIRVQKSRCVIAFAVIKGIDLALTKVQTDAGVENIRDLLVDPRGFDAGTPIEQINHHSELIYELMQHGKDAAFDLKPEYRGLLADKYMKLENDPWGRKYLVYFPARRSEATEFEKSLLSFYGAPSDWTPEGANNLPNYFIFSAGKDGALEVFSNKQQRGPDGNVLKFGDDISNIHHFEIGW